MLKLLPASYVALLATGLVCLCVCVRAVGGEHPRLLFGPEDIPKLREKAQREPFTHMVAALDRRLDKADKDYAKASEGHRILYDTHPRLWATLYVLTGERAWAEKAEQRCLEMIAHPWWSDKRSKGLTRAAAGVTVALAYDLCHDAWSKEARQRISRALHDNAYSMGVSMGAHANRQMANNWQAVRYAGMGLAALACDEPDGERLARWAFPRLLRHLEVNLGENGWNPEGIGYTLYPWKFTGPFGIAAERAGLGDVREKLPRVRKTLWTTLVGTVAIENFGGRVGLRADLADDHPAWGGGGCAGLAFHYVPEEYVPAVRWMYDYLCGQRGDGTWDARGGGSLYSILYYPADVEPKNPAEVVGLNYVDASHGLVLFRNRFEDENDIVALVNAAGRRPRGCHAGPDTNTFRILGLGGAWAVGGGRTGCPEGQTNLFPAAPGRRAPGGLGELVEHHFGDDGSGRCVTVGSCMGVKDHRRVFAADFSGDGGAPAVFVDAETSANGRLWRLNTPGCNRIETDAEAGRFTIRSPVGSSLACAVIVPESVAFRTGRRVRGNSVKQAHNPGYLYRGKQYYHNRWVEFDCDGDVLVVMTLQRGEPPEVRGEGAARNATLRVGEQTVRVNGGDVTFGP
jgi:hypothetical protein